MNHVAYILWKHFNTDLEMNIFDTFKRIAKFNVETIESGSAKSVGLTFSAWDPFVTLTSLSLSPPLSPPSMSHETTWKVCTLQCQLKVHQ